MWKPLFFSHFPSFPLNLGQTLAVPSQQMMSSAMGWVCFHLSEQQDSEPPAWSSASLTHNRSCLPRVGEENATAYFPVLWIFSELQTFYFLSVLFWKEPKLQILVLQIFWNLAFVFSLTVRWWSVQYLWENRLIWNMPLIYWHLPTLRLPTLCLRQLWHVTWSNIFLFVFVWFYQSPKWHWVN